MLSSRSLTRGAAGSGSTGRRGGALPRAAGAPRRQSVRARASGAEWTGRQFTALSTTEAATAHLAALLAEDLRPGDSLCLKGDEGAGKSVFVREFIRAVYGDAGKAVAPPTRTLEPVTYEGHDGPPIQHVDLRGVAAPGDAERAALADTFARGVSLIENAERLQEWGAAPEQRLALWIRRLPSGAGQDNVRLVTVVPHTGSWELRAGLLHANLSRTGTPVGLVILSDDMGASMIEGLPEALLLAKA